MVPSSSSTATLLPSLQPLIYVLLQGVAILPPSLQPLIYGVLLLQGVAVSSLKTQTCEIPVSQKMLLKSTLVCVLNNFHNV